jgi:hypothetical protein
MIVRVRVRMIVNKVKDIERDNSGGSTRTERIETKNKEEYRRSACEDL